LLEKETGNFILEGEVIRRQSLGLEVWKSELKGVSLPGTRRVDICRPTPEGCPCTYRKGKKDRANTERSEKGQDGEKTGI